MGRTSDQTRRPWPDLHVYSEPPPDGSVSSYLGVRPVAQMAAQGECTRRLCPEVLGRLLRSHRTCCSYVTRHHSKKKCESARAQCARRLVVRELELQCEASCKSFRLDQNAH